MIVFVDIGLWWWWVIMVVCGSIILRLFFPDMIVLSIDSSMVTTIAMTIDVGTIHILNLIQVNLLTIIILYSIRIPSFISYLSIAC